MKYQAVLFDMDGTLLDTLDVISLSVNSSLLRMGLLSHATNDYKKMVGDGVEKLCLRALPENLRSDANAVKELRIGFEAVYIATQDKLIKAYDGIAELLGALQQKGVKRAIITNKPQELAYKSAASFLPDCFDCILGQSEENPCKPDPKTALQAAKIMQVDTEKCLFLGDSRADMQTGVNAGMVSVGALWGFSSKELLQENGAKLFAKTPLDVLLLLE